MVIYARGELGLDDDGGLVKRFLTTAVPEIRASAVEFLGRIAQENVELPEDVVQRLMTLWEWYWPTVGTLGTDRKRDASVFGFWFASGKFPNSWALDWMLKFMDQIGVAQPDHLVIERLEKMAAEDITRVMRITDKMVRGDARGDGWHVMSWEDSLTKILEAAMLAGGAARSTADELIDFLGRRGFMQYGKLLAI